MVLLAFATIGLIPACKTGESSTDDVNNPSCRPDSMELSITGRVRIASFDWQEGRLVSARYSYPTGKVRDLAYSYDEQNRISSVLDRLDNGSFVRTYNDQGHLQTITSTKDKAEIRLAYNSKGQVASQAFTNVNGDTTRLFTFTYDANGLPRTSITIDPVKKEEVSEYLFTFHDTPNPLHYSGMMVNVFMSSYGVPVGMCGKQLASVKITYLRDPAGPVNGKAMRAGDSEMVTWSVETNEQNWPTYWKMQRGEFINEARFWYTCK